MRRFFSSIPKIVEQSKTMKLANLKRMDTHGNTFVIAENVPVDKAELMAKEFEARGHKQTYWAEEIGISRINPIF